MDLRNKVRFMCASTAEILATDGPNTFQILKKEEGARDRTLALYVTHASTKL